MSYQVEDRIEPQGEALKIAEKVMEQMGILFNYTDTVVQLYVLDNGVQLYMEYISTRMGADDKTHEYKALMTWDELLNGDVRQWAERARQESNKQLEDKVRLEQERMKEQEFMNAQNIIKHQRKKDLETYERIKQEMAAQENTGL